MKNGKYGMLFSGGVDAYSSLLDHLDKSPMLITIWGADVSTKDGKQWEEIKNIISETSYNYNLEKTFIKSNFKEFLNTEELNKLILISNDKWWHGFQHGIGLIGLTAPVSYKENIELIYIAASHTKNDDVPCASHPTIDESVRWFNTNICHDQFDMTRQMKIEKIIKESNRLNIFPNLHVCWQNNGSGKNCCNCEKCCRTMLGIMVANDLPQKYGFDNYDGKHIEYRMKFFNEIKESTYYIWQEIIEKYKENNIKSRFRNNISWLERFNIKEKNKLRKKIFRNIEKICKK